MTYEWEPGNSIEDIEVQEINEKEEDESEERTTPKLLSIEIETNHIEEPSENEEICVEDGNDVIEWEEDNVDLLDVVDNIVTNEEWSTYNDENNSQIVEERSNDNEERPSENKERSNENKDRHCKIQEHMDDENINNNIHDDRTAVDDEEIIDEIWPLPNTAQDHSSLKSRLRPRNKAPNSHQDSYSKEFIHTHVKKKRVTWKQQEEKNEENQTKH